jgi:hypothetical protein
MSNFDEEFFKSLLREEREECLKGPGLDLELHEAFVEACQGFQDAKEAKDAAEKDLEDLTKAKGGGASLAAKKEAQEMLAVWKTAMDDALTACVEAAKPILETISLKDHDLEMSLLRTALLSRATPKGMTKFADESDMNGQLIETLMNSKKIMKEMILHGGARNNEFGAAMKSYTHIMAHLKQDRFQKVNKKIAMAVALEFCVARTEFDTSTEISHLERFHHYEKAHRRGELDPAFSHFKTWEYRMAINSDAPHEQLQWGRDMLFNYAPHLATIYDEKHRYTYQVKTDVGYRAPHWTSSPRTYQQVLSGGGREGPRAWYGRFIAQAFGIPVWGLKQPSNVAMSRWTPKGWEVMLSNIPPNDAKNNPMIHWNVSSYEGRLGWDFLLEAKARSAVSDQEYFEKVTLLECLGDACKEKPPKNPEDNAYVHPQKVWRSLALMQKKLFAEQATEESFQRTGPSVVVTKIEKYIEELNESAPPLPFEVEKRGGVIIPAASFSDSNGKLKAKAMQSFGEGTQLHLMNGEGEVTYEIPSNVSLQEDKDYMLTALVCTVSLEQTNLLLNVDGSETYEIEIPYTVGRWEETKPIQIKLGALSQLRFYRKPAKPDICFGLAIKSFTIAPC